MKPSVLMVSSEAGPWAKTGGLADVLGALPAALAKLGHRIGVVIPRYMDAADAPAKRVYENLWILVGSVWYEVSIWELKKDGVSYFFVDQADLFDRPGLYGDHKGDFPDNHIRFTLLSKAAIEIVRRLFPVDILHGHDWQAGLLPFLVKDVVDPHFVGTRMVLTIHNLGYQGIFEASAMEELGLPASIFHPDGIEFWGRVNFLKAGIVFADTLTTVSPTYAEEIQTPEYGFGLDGLLAKRRKDLHGILNGVDYARWDPAGDPAIPATYSVSDLSGKRVCKQELVREMELPEGAMDRPLLGVVARFVSQKGFELLEQAAEQIFREDLSLVALGNGEARWEVFFQNLQTRFPGKVAVREGYDDGLAHRIEAGADMFLMPSLYEPCGLNQIYSLRYGTVPVVRATGGLEDTVADWPGDGPENQATGFKFRDYNGEALLGAIRRACVAWKDREAWTAMIARGMRKDFSWTASAGEYSRLYAEIASFGAENDSKL